MSFNYVYVVNYHDLNNTRTKAVGVFKKYDTAIDYLTVNSSHSYSQYLNSGGCDICRKMLNRDILEHVCTECANYHLCIDCFKPNLIKHTCRVEEELLEIKRDIKENNYAEDDDGNYTIDRVIIY